MHAHRLPFMMQLCLRRIARAECQAACRMHAHLRFSSSVALHAAVASALVACGAPAGTCLAVVPKGPGSHEFAASLDLPLNAYEALEVAAKAECAAIDLGTLNKRQVAQKPSKQRLRACPHALCMFLIV